MGPTSATFDLVIIGAGPAGEGAGFKAAAAGLRVAVVERRWVGGSCPHIGCLPSKALLHGAQEHHANAAAYPWPRASAHRDYMINRAPDAAEPDDSGHAQRLTDAGADVYRGDAQITGRGVVRVRHDGVDPRAARRRRSSSRSGRRRGSRRSTAWPTSRRGPTSRRRSPASCRAAWSSWAAARPAASSPRSTRASACPTTIVQSGPRLAPTDHPRNSEVVRADPRARRRRRPDRGPRRARPGRRRDGRRATSSTSTTASTASGHEVLLAVGREFPLDGLGLEHYGLDVTGRTPYPRDGRLRVAEGLYVAGDPAGPELHTHQAHYQGELAVRMALGEVGHARLPGPAAGDVHRSGGRLRGRDRGGRPRGRPRRLRARGRLRDEHARLRHPGRAGPRHDRRRPGDPPARRAWPSPARTRRRPSTSACWPSRRACRWTSWPRPSTPSRRRRGSSTGCSPTPCASSTTPGSVVTATTD